MNIFDRIMLAAVIAKLSNEIPCKCPTRPYGQGYQPCGCNKRPEPKSPPKRP